MVLGFLLLAPKTFFLGPLAVLLILSRPTKAREWIWIGIAVAAVVLMLRLPATLTDRTVRAAGIFFTGAFVIASLIGIRSLFNRAALATALAGLVTTIWYRALGLGWHDLTSAVASYTWSAWRSQMPELPEIPPEGISIASGTTANIAAELAMAMRAASALFPALIALTAMGGGWLAWSWYHRVASHPIGKPSEPWRNFRFSDHLIWLVIATAAVVLVGVDGPASVVANNLLVVLLVLYAGRGLAVIQTALIPAPKAMGLLLIALSLILSPLAGSVCILTGIADTWLDLRRRMTPSQGAQE